MWSAKFEPADMFGPERRPKTVRIWIDISNSPHVRFFEHMIQELKNDHEVIVSARALSNTLDLLEMEHIAYRVVGRHYGASVFGKSLGLAARTFQLYGAMRRTRPDVAVSHSSYYLPLAARLLGVPSLYLNDNEHFAGNRFAFRAATRVMVPEHFSAPNIDHGSARSRAFIRYPGIKEGVYLWQLSRSKRTGTESVLGRPRVFMRPEPWSAEYYHGGTDFLDSLLREMSEWADIVVLPRDRRQALHYAELGIPHVKVMDEPVTLETLRFQCDLFVGAGGTMTREAAVLGLPAISVYRSELLGVDRFLMELGLVYHCPRLQANEAREILTRQPRVVSHHDLMKKGKDAYRLILEQILELGRSCQIA